MRALCSVLVALSVFTPDLAGQTAIARTIPEGVRVVSDLVYARYGERELKLDLYLPSASAARTQHVVVVIRGFAWRQGDKEGFGPIAAALAQRGIPAASIEYRSVGEALFPAAVHDTKAAVRWLRANAESYGLNPAAVGALGGSAGAHLASYLGVTAGRPELEGAGGSQEQSSRVQAVVALAPPTDLTAVDERDPQLTVNFLGVPFEGNVDRWKYASPVTYVNDQAPPILMTHSEVDPQVAPGQSLRLAER